MKRPLCGVMLLLAAAVLLLMLVIPSGEYRKMPSSAYITRTGLVTGKELKKENRIVYLKVPKEETTLMLYLAEGESLPLIGTVIKVRGKCMEFSEATNPGEFDSQSYYRILKIAYRIMDAKILETAGDEDKYREFLYCMKIKLGDNLSSNLSEKDAGIMKAILLGDKGDLDEEIKDVYKRNGIIHIIAISGLHISFLGLSLYKLLRKMSLHILPSVAVCIALMYTYGVMCGMSASAFRAIFMFAVKIFADVIGRTYDMLSAMSLSAICLLIEQPLFLKHGGFLMSFGAILALGYVLPTFPDIMKKGVAGLFSASIAILIISLPIYTQIYYKIPIFAVVLNIFILPFMGILMFLGIILAVIPAAVFASGKVFAFLVHLILAWFELCCSAGDSLYGGSFYVGHSSPLQVVIYVFCVILFVLLYEYRDLMKELIRKILVRYYKKIKEAEDINSKKRGQEFDRQAGRLFVSFRCLILTVGIVVLVFRIRAPFKVTFLDVGQGDGIVIETKTANYLIDGGSTSKKNVGKYRLIPFLSYEGAATLDAVIMTHEDEDHISGIFELLDEMGKSRGAIQIKNLILPDISEKSKNGNYIKLVEKAEKLHIPVSYISSGDEIKDENIFIKCLGPCRDMRTDEPNAYSTILYARIGNFTALFTGDVESTGLENLKDNIRELRKTDKKAVENLTVLKVAHHGSRYTTDKEFLNMTKPRFSIISCGTDNRYGHPHKELLQRLENIGSKTISTSKNGAVTIKSDGENMRLSCFFKNVKYEF